MKLFSQQLNPALIAKSHHMDQLTSILNSELPPETSGHYHVANVDNSTLVIITDSPVWTTRLRQLGPLIIQILTNNTARKLQHVRIVSRHGPIKAPFIANPLINRVLSEKSAQQVAQASEYIKDKELKEALLKLSKRGKKTD
ncbi:MAG: DUF721 domain-containing protein [Gammaproteobacteria bacterium]|nr:DUF721 domain-containing protein [Gammaproteobacteria bacterium]